MSLYMTGSAFQVLGEQTTDEQDAEAGKKWHEGLSNLMSEGGTRLWTRGNLVNTVCTAGLGSWR